MALSHSASGASIDAYSATTSQFLRRGAISQVGFRSGRGSVLSGVVPDGVASVTLHFPARLDGTHQASSVSVTARPIENVFVVRVPRRVTPQAFGGSAPVWITWRAANGTVIRTIHPSS